MAVSKAECVHFNQKCHQTWATKQDFKENILTPPSRELKNIIEHSQNTAPFRPFRKQNVSILTKNVTKLGQQRRLFGVTNRKFLAQLSSSLNICLFYITKHIYFMFKRN